jgi:hypothetical protein
LEIREILKQPPIEVLIAIDKKLDEELEREGRDPDRINAALDRPRPRG